MNHRAQGTNYWKVIAIGLLAVALAGFVVSPALGGPGFLTKKKAAKIYLSKKTAGKKYLTQKGADDRYYRKGDVFTKDDANAKFPAASGDIRVPIFPTSWFLPTVPSGVTPSGTISYFRIGNTAAVPAVDAYTPIAAPAELYGRPVTIKGIELCQRFNPGVALNQVGLEVIPGTGDNPTVDPAELVQSYAQAVTNVTASGCETITVPSTPLSSNQPTFLSLRFSLSASQALRLGRATLILSAN